MGLENIQREDLSFYERGRWVHKILDTGWLITSLARETGIPQPSLSNWLTFYNESERIKTSSTVDEKFKPEKLPLRGILEVKRAQISEEKVGSNYWDFKSLYPAETYIDDEMTRKNPETNLSIIDEDLWNWAKYRSSVLGCKSVSDYIFDLIRRDKQRAEGWNWRRIKPSKGFTLIRGKILKVWHTYRMYSTFIVWFMKIK